MHAINISNDEFGRMCQFRFSARFTLIYYIGEMQIRTPLFWFLYLFVICTWPTTDDTHSRRFGHQQIPMVIFLVISCEINCSRRKCCDFSIRG